MTSEPDFDDDFARKLTALMRWRRDVRHFLPRPIDQAEMQALFAAAASAPSVGNAQPWRFVRVRSPARREALAAHVDARAAEAAADHADPGRRALYGRLKLHGVREAPELLAVFCEREPVAGHRLGRATMPETLRYSCVMAIHAMWLAARARGIGLGWVSILEPGAVSAMLDVAASWELIALLCIGYPAQTSAAPELEQRGWQAREPIEDRISER